MRVYIGWLRYNIAWLRYIDDIFMIWTESPENRKISDGRVTWERVSQKLNILTARRRGPLVVMG